MGGTRDEEGEEDAGKLAQGTITAHVSPAAGKSCPFLGLSIGMSMDSRSLAELVPLLRSGPQEGRCLKPFRKEPGKGPVTNPATSSHLRRRAGGAGERSLYQRSIGRIAARRRTAALRLAPTALPATQE